MTSLDPPPCASHAPAVGGFIGPYLLGRLSDRADGGFTAAMVMLACFLGASGTCLLLFPAPGQRPSDGARDWEQASDDDSGSQVGLQGAVASDGAAEDEEGAPLAGGRSSGEHAVWGGAAADEGEGRSQWRQQQWELQRERLRGAGSGSSRSRSLSRKGSRGEMEFQPILPAQGDRSS